MKRPQTIPDLLDALGLTEGEHTGDHNHLYAGDGVVRGRHDFDLLHEVAHFQIASQSRRFKPGYGLGPEPEATNLDADQLVSNETADNEESLASLLGILWQRHFGSDWGHTLTLHGWCVHADTIIDTVHELLEWNLLDSRGTPKVHLRDKQRKVSKKTAERISGFIRAEIKRQLRQFQR